MTATITVAIPTPKTVEVRIPTGPTATGQSKTWSKTLTTCSRSAKTGYDYGGSWLQDGKLSDLEQGDLFIVGGSRGSRKHATKYVGLYCVIDQDQIVLVAERTSDEWAVQLRDFACDLLDLDWVGRCRKVLGDEIEFLSDPENTPVVSERLKAGRAAGADGFVRLEKGEVVSWLRVSDGGWFHCGLLVSREAHYLQQAGDLARLEAEYSASVKNHEAGITRLRKQLAHFEALGAPAPTERPEVATARAAFLALTLEEQIALLAELS